MKKDVNNHHHQTQNIQICTANANTRININNKTASGSIAVKNVRSSSLPLKIISNSNRFSNHSNNNNNRSTNHVRSWTDYSYLSKQRNNFDCFNLNGLYFNYKYRQISRSERFLDFIEFREQSYDELNSIKNFNSNSSISSSSSSPSIFSSDLKCKFSKLNSLNNNRSSNKSDEDDYDDFNNNQSNDSSSSSSAEDESVSSNGNITLINTKNENETKTIELIKNCESKLAQISEETTFCVESKEEEVVLEKSEQVQNLVKIKTSEEQETATKIEEEINNNNNEINTNTVVEKAIINNNNENIQIEAINNESNERVIEQDETKVANDKIDNNKNNNNDNIVKIENDIALSESSLAANLIESTRLDEDLNREDELLDKNMISESEQVVVTDEKNINNDTLIASSNDIFESEEELNYKNFVPKKSCLKPRISFGELSNSDYGSGLSMDGTSTNATSSPLVSPSSPSYNNSNCSLWSTSESTSVSTSTCSSASSTATKKRVLFADDAGKELFTVRTMSEPSNCPPKLTSKIVQYFLNREFNNQNSLTSLSRQLSSESMSNYSNGDFFSSTRSYDYGISGLNYTNDINQVSGSLAVYSLNFQQPAGDYLKFRQRLDQKNVSLENVLLNGFQVNGTIKVKNINFHKNVFIRCSFNNWASYEDYKAIYVPCDFYSSSQLSPTLTSSSIYASFCGSNNSHYQPIHKDYDTFRFEFQLPKTVESFTAQALSDRNATASIQLCVCYRTGAGDDTREYWDNNDGKNYEIFQYVIDLERLRPNSRQVSIQTAATTASNQLRNKKTNYYKYDKSNYSASLLTTESGIYY